MNLFYPIGAIYASTTSTSPGTLFGGTWQQISNAALRAATASIATYTGSDTHTLTVNEIPAHKHNLSVPMDGGGYYGWHLATTQESEYGLSNTTCANVGGGSTLYRATLLQLLYVEENSLESRWSHEHLDV